MADALLPSPSNVITGNSSNNADPNFIDSASRNYVVQPPSLAIDTGLFLTTVTSADATGTSLVVDDARYFYDGWGIPGEVGDIIQLEGQAVRARILEVDYDTGVITLETALSWQTGLGVSLSYSGIRPDIGAFEYAPSDTDPPGPPGNSRLGFR